MDGSPTAFRAWTRDELVPTLRQLQSRHPAAEMKWFERGRLWDSPADARPADRGTAGRPGGADRRGPDWRPGGAHLDPRARFKKTRAEKRRLYRKRLQTRATREAGGARTAAGPHKRGPGRKS